MRGFLVVLIWGVLLAALVAVQGAFPSRWLQVGLAAGVAAVVLLLGALLALRPADEDRVRLLPESSYATVLAAVGVVMVAMGLVFGSWLYLIGAGVLALGLGGVARELVAARRRAAG
jgi:hypothetical protein